MRHPMIKLGVAAVIVMTAILGLNIMGGPDAAHVAWGQVLQTIETVPTVVFHMTNITTFGENNTRSAESTVYDAGKHGSRIDTYLNGELFSQKFMLLDEKLFYFIRPQEKIYYRSVLPEDYKTESDTPRQWVKAILSENYTQLGQRTIDGIACEGVEVLNSKVLAGDEGTVRLWVDVASNLPVRIELETLGMESGRRVPMQYVMDDFQWDVELAEGLFEPQIPDDFTQREEPKTARGEPPTKAEQAPARALTEQEQAQQAQIEETVRQFFQACRDRNWDEILRCRPGFERLNAEQRASVEKELGGLEVTEIGEPFKTEASDDIWHVPCRISRQAGTVTDDEIRVRYEEALSRFVICGGP